MSKSLKPRLGRGLSSLIVNSTAIAPEPQVLKHPVVTIDTASTYVATDEQVATRSLEVRGLGRGVVEVLVDQIAPNPYQPRRDFDGEELSDLARSIETQGILQPLLVRPRNDGEVDVQYVLIAGERRLRAAKLAGLTSVPCLLRQAHGREMLEWALIENIQRKDLNPIERADAYRQYVDRFSLSHADAAERLGQARVTITNHLRILDLDEAVRAGIASGQISFGHAKVLAGLLDQPARQRALAELIVRDGLSVRQLEVRIAQAEQQAGQTTESRRAKAPHILDLEGRLSQAVGTRVAIQAGRAKNSGRIVIDYYSLDDFDRIAASLGMSEAV